MLRRVFSSQVIIIYRHSYGVGTSASHQSSSSARSAGTSNIEPITFSQFAAFITGRFILRLLAWWRSSMKCVMSTDVALSSEDERWSQRKGGERVVIVRLDVKRGHTVEVLGIEDVWLRAQENRTYLAVQVVNGMRHTGRKTETR